MKWPRDLFDRLTQAAVGGIELAVESDRKGVHTGWGTLADAADLAAVARVLKDCDARLSTIAAFQPRPVEEDDWDDDDGDAADEEAGDAIADVVEKTFFGGLPFDGETYELDYHFDFAGDTFTVIVHLPKGGAVVSLTPLWRVANWTEREFMELYGIAVDGHPDPRRLFIDPSLDNALLERLVPQSTLINAASTEALWAAIRKTREARNECADK